jgi:hypothetical protein
MIPARELLRQAGGDVNHLARIQARVRTRLLPVDLFGNPFYTGF